MNIYPFIEAEKAHQRNVKRACQLLEVSRAAYYAHGPTGRRSGSRSTRSSPSTSARPTRRPRAAMAPRGSMRSCVARGAGTAASVWPA